ncbi:hypothetical protein LOTGIDRAFT_159181 [Lottia gigantea]|uniref:Multidrug and toxin extrusion protein n=1 Tax=Lottia gigantea TaxID=225164 RepID=V4AXR0_LOTGI|nr:hypothetical protein LOTGIDRAFT_159181 [Lottia gigantea]ESO98376.1 hypothetical protein LOTGIDRAFT_159181 [Lottia gigantea]
MGSIEVETLETISRELGEDGDRRFSQTTTFLKSDMKTNCFLRLYRHVFPRGYKSEFKILFKLSWPTVLVQLFEQALFIISLMFCGHLGKQQLDGVALALTLINVAGCSILQGLAAGCETLFSQTFGSKNKMKVGIILQQSILILGIVCFPCWAFLLNVDHILISVGQLEDVSRNALQYAMWFIPGIPGYALCMILTRYLRAQSIVIPSFVCSFLSTIMTAVYHGILVYWWQLGIRGAGLGLSLGFWTNGLLHILYIKVTKLYKTTWPGISWHCLEDWKLYMSLAFPGMLMLCLEWWSFEVLVFFAGMLGATSLAAHSIIYQMAAMAFMAPMGLAQAGCVRVGNLLGEGQHQLALTSAHVVITCTFGVAIFDAVIICSFRNYIPLAFTSDIDVIKLTSSLLLILSVFHFIDAAEGVVGGVLRGVGRQKFGAVINLIAYYIIGIPAAFCLMFLTTIDVAGAWWGICCGSFFQCVAFFIRISRLNWVEEAQLASMRAGISKSKTQGVSDEMFSDEEGLIETDQLLLTDSVSDSLNSSDTQSLVLEKQHKKHLILLRLIPVTCCVLVFIVGLLLHLFLHEPSSCYTIDGNKFNLTFLQDLLSDPEGHNLTRSQITMLNQTYYFEVNHFRNSSYLYCPNGDTFTSPSEYNETRLFQSLHPNPVG